MIRLAFEGMLFIVFYEFLPIDNVFIHYFIPLPNLFQNAFLIHLKIDVVMLVEENLVIGFVCPDITITKNIILDHILPKVEDVDKTHLFFFR